ncbi:MAG: ankyrin repeat domain-containing protein [Nitrospiria bacterium]
MMASEQTKRRYKAIGLGLVTIGLAIHAYQSLMLMRNDFSLMLVAEFVLPMVGLIFYARTKGRTDWWALMVIFPMVGPILGLAILTVLPDRSHVEKILEIEIKSYSSIAFTVCIIGIGLLFSWISYSVIMERNSENTARYRVYSLYGVFKVWQADPRMGDGTLPENVNTIGKDGRTFAQHFPKEGEWLKSGDGYYAYSYTLTEEAEGKIIPHVTAKARKPGRRDVTVMAQGAWHSQTGLIAAARKGLYDSVEAILAKGADVNEKDQMGRTALMLAEDNDHTDIVKMLLNAGAVGNLTNRVLSVMLQQ